MLAAHLILPSSFTPTDAIASARTAADEGLIGTWIGERAGADAPARLASLAAGCPAGFVGFGAVPLTARTADQVHETLTTATLLARGRVRIAFDLPLAAAGSTRPSWASALTDIAPVVHAAGVEVEVVAHDAQSASIAAQVADVVTVRGADLTSLHRLHATLARAGRPVRLEVWLDAHSGPDHGDLAATLAERLAVPGIPGRQPLLDVARRSYAGLTGAVEAAYAAGDVAAAAQLIPDDLVRAVCLTGTMDDVAGRLRALREVGVDAVGIVPHGRGQGERLESVRLVASAMHSLTSEPGA